MQKHSALMDMDRGNPTEPRVFRMAVLLLVTPFPLWAWPEDRCVYGVLHEVSSWGRGGVEGRNFPSLAQYRFSSVEQCIEQKSRHRVGNFW